MSPEKIILGTKIKAGDWNTGWTWHFTITRISENKRFVYFKFEPTDKKKHRMLYRHLRDNLTYCDFGKGDMYWPYEVIEN